jgi:hypothetical protein
MFGTMSYKNKSLAGRVYIKRFPRIVRLIKLIRLELELGLELGLGLMLRVKVRVNVRVIVTDLIFS